MGLFSGMSADKSADASADALALIIPSYLSILSGSYYLETFFVTQIDT